MSGLIFDPVVLISMAITHFFTWGETPGVMWSEQHFCFPFSAARSICLEPRNVRILETDDRIWFGRWMQKGVRCRGRGDSEGQKGIKEMSSLQDVGSCTVVILWIGKHCRSIASNHNERRMYAADD